MEGESSGERKLPWKLLLLGDCMLGRLVDQLFPDGNPEPYERNLALSLLSRDPSSSLRLSSVGPAAYIWGDALPILRSADVRMANLETSVTSHSVKWPGQAFNFRMHPRHVAALKLAE